MKASGKMANSKAKVRKKWFVFCLLILIFFGGSKGKWFGINGNR